MNALDSLNAQKIHWENVRASIFLLIKHHKNSMMYSQEEYQYWKLKDPIEKLKNQILLEDANLEEKIIRFKNSINQEIITAFEYAENSQYPDQEEAYKGVYSSG